MSFRSILEALDVSAARSAWADVAPHLPQPKTDAEALVMLHHARTQAASMPLNLRAYSHRWLLDQGYPSGLPDELKPRAERIYPKIVSGVGISVNVRSAYMQPIAAALRGAMSDAVMDAYADGKTDPAFVSARMREAREKVMRTA